MVLRCLLLAICASVAVVGCDGTSPAFRLPTAPGTTTSGPQPPTGGQPPLAPTRGPYYVAGSGQPIASGQRVVETVMRPGVSCFDAWDASATCQIYEFVAPQQGRLEVTARGMTASRGDVIDLFLVEAQGPWVVAYEGEQQEHATIPVKTGVSYGILLLTYPYALPIELEVLAEFR